MVAPISPRGLFESTEVNLARPYLLRAQTAFDAGNLVEAGCLLREAVIRQLRAMCAWHGCEVKQAKHPRPGDYIRALQKAGKLGEIAEWFEEMLEFGNRLAHCKPVKPGHISCSIGLLHTLIDSSPCGEPKERLNIQHKPGLFDPPDKFDDDADDPEDGSDWWKGGGDDE